MQGGHITLFSELQDPFTCQDTFLVADMRIVSANEGRLLQRRGSHMCAFAVNQSMKELNQHTSPAAQCVCSLTPVRAVATAGSNTGCR